MKNNFKQNILKEKEFESFAAEFLYNTLKILSENKKGISIALSGGSTPLPILSILKEYKLNWEYFNFFMVDERNVSISSSSSNYGNIEKVFFRDVNFSGHSMINDNYSIEECAINYEKLLCSKIPLGENNLPISDLIDLPSEKARLFKTIEKTENEVSMLSAKLANEKFINKAPETVINEVKIRLEELNKEQKKLSGALDRLKAVGP